MQVTCDFGEMSSFVRLEQHHRPAEELKKIVPRFASATVPLCQSLMKDKIHIYSDAALFHSRRSRIGWGPDLKLAQLEGSGVSIASIETSNFWDTPKSVLTPKLLFFMKLLCFITYWKMYFKILSNF